MRGNPTSLYMGVVEGMSQEYIEVTEKTVDDAITTACQKLSVTSDRLDYVVISHGSSGFLGFGGKPAIIKARVKEAAEATQAILDEVLGKVNQKAEQSAQDAESEEKKSESAKKQEVKPQHKEEQAVSWRQEKTEKKSEKSEEKAAEKATEKSAAQKSDSNHRGTRPERDIRTGHGEREIHTGDVMWLSNDSQEKRESGNESFRQGRGRGNSGERNRGNGISKVAPEKQLSDEKIAEIKKKAEDFLTEVFHAMNMEVTISSEFVKELNVLNIDMNGDDMGILIGKRGQTLDSLQYLVSLVVNKGTDGYIHVKADTENYRERRKKTLENLAKNIAYKVKRTKQPVKLEPMNPYERRIIHSALQGDKYVTTYSEGEEPFRHVIVALKK